MPLALALALAAPSFPVTPCVPPTPQEQASAATADKDLAPRARASAALASAWLVQQQQPDGSWLPGADPVPMKPAPGGGVSDDEFWDEVLGGGSPDLVPEAKAKARPGEDVYAVGVTGLALLSLCADGQLGEDAPHRKAALRAAGWLLAQQDAETGCIGNRVGFAFLYDHAIATLALLAVHREDADLAIAIRTDKAEPAAVALAPRIQSALVFIAQARNPYRVWRYDVPPTGDNDTSITTWMTLAHAAGKAQGLKVDAHATEGILAWMDEMTEEGTGRVGYTERGSTSSRVPGANVQFDVTDAETLTAAGLMCRLELGQSPRTGSAVAHVKCMLRALPDEDEQLRDALWVYFGTRAMASVGSKPWRLWRDKVMARALSGQVGTGPLKGSWAPRTAWSYASGRVGTTALMSLAASIASNQ